MSLKVRLKGANTFRQTNKCYTCNKTFPIKELQAGHFWHSKLDFDERNLKPQCVRCNHYFRGNLGIYASRLIRENGLFWFDQLKRDADKKGNNYKLSELKKLYEQLKSDNSAEA